MFFPVDAGSFAQCGLKLSRVYLLELGSSGGDLSLHSPPLPSCRTTPLFLSCRVEGDEEEEEVEGEGFGQETGLQSQGNYGHIKLPCPCHVSCLQRVNRAAHSHKGRPTSESRAELIAFNYLHG